MIKVIYDRPFSCNVYSYFFLSVFQRFGSALVPSGNLNLKKKQFAKDFRPIDENCSCSTCKTYTRAYLHTIASHEAVACTLISVHNVAYQVGGNPFNLETINISRPLSSFPDLISSISTGQKSHYPPLKISYHDK